MWFNDLNGGRWDSNLSSEESEKIADFTRAHAARKDLLDTDHGLQALHASDAWPEVVLEARRTLDALLRLRS